MKKNYRFYTHEEAGHAVNCLNQTKLDNRVIRVDWDIGFSEGRQFGRGKHGFQWRDFYRQKDDPERPKIPNYPNKQIKKNEDKEYDSNKKNVFFSSCYILKYFFFFRNILRKIIKKTKKMMGILTSMRTIRDIRIKCFY